MKTLDFDFYLPPHLIAQHPLPNRSESRLLEVNALTQSIRNHHFREIAAHFEAGDVLVLNDTKVIKARLFGQKATGGHIEVMIDRVLSPQEAYAQIKSSRSPKAGSLLHLSAGYQAEVLGRHADMFHIQLLGEASWYDFLEQYGQLPLPPYIEHTADAADDTRYQTVFAKHAGAVAAPTAGLHFDEALLQALIDKGVHVRYVTLHVGAGTFQPVKVDDIADHHMHSEVYHLPADTIQTILEARANGKRVTAVGTTSLRTLESAAHVGKLFAHHGDTNIFITPGFEFKLVDRLITNFHLPKSTLMMLVSAFGGYDLMREAYAHAIEEAYRFFSYGDAMLITRAPSPKG
ncbi:tRNA preQ1(34) S-adenosylmethionine ribosyltransferase-isomerase QueA [Methylophilus medardicus]|uniref:S-adenosylmethionine:tRNA ribosyltransferase-isomerase n=1 Tax=Methylophilus medardicus TaxID=2588534 RepID=A0A5B8CUL4_9PROT|nr:tRNA preQ1(34) S-adenosylmethionine ribosyltransferase-isomerase QueA [Methylophilus medardicus]QDC44820.1 tRNA preQ1(34) S-adenosylmethionine ribosyltransferase-isomerase QueA [Methylophilus medardicus]QDC49827.1 tRNA preQ1(34) S-adenosylmethionine ribosyltransferase-isomerase QueA [Methylophilus medardicus]QDC53532.1 tRNA preQ1(34) S-adenosylmethionine ribosyltransferase-isomerase QueA [Methylophilus medardicus]